MTDTPALPPAASRLQAIISDLSSAHKAAVEAADGYGDGVVLVDGYQVAMAIRRATHLAQDMTDGVEHAPVVFMDGQSPPLREIVEACAKHYQIPMGVMTKPGKVAAAKTARQAYYLISSRIHGSKKSTKQIAIATGLKDHTSAIHGIDTGQRLYNTDREFFLDVTAIERSLLG